MRKISLLDCTLRDGGSLNDWNFGYKTANSIFKSLVDSNIEIVEIGFIDDRRCFDKDRTINPTTKCFDEVFKNQSKKQSFVVGMINFGVCSIDNIT